MANCTPFPTPITYPLCGYVIVRKGVALPITWDEFFSAAETMTQQMGSMALQYVVALADEQLLHALIAYSA